MITKFGIHIKSKNLIGSYKFYKAFELKPVFAYGDKKWLKMIDSDFGKTPNAPEKYNGVTFDIGNSLLEIANGHIAVKPDVFTQEIRSSKMSLMVDVASLSYVLEICERHRINIIKKPVAYPWGTTEMVVKDPDGAVIVFRSQSNN